MKSIRFFLVVLVLIFGTGCAGKSDIRLAGPGQDVELTATPFFPQKKYQCGPAALAMLLGASGVAVRPDDLAPVTYLPDRQGSLQVEMMAACRQSGRIPFLIPRDISGLIAEIQSGRPVLVLQNFGFEWWPVYHYAVVIGMRYPDRLVLRSGTRKRVEMATDRFNRTWERAGSWGMISLHPGDLPRNIDQRDYLNAVAAFESAGNAITAAAAYRTARGVWPDNPAVLFALANNHLRNDEPAQAAAHYRTLLAADPNHVAAANNLAEALVRQDDLDEALAVIQTAVETAERIQSPLLEVIQQTRLEIKQALQRVSIEPGKPLDREDGSW
ncbi:MAG: PA2778 family cysteine peptidase [Desulfotignum sp.]|nr:PA2778 family cysteine peptidase [Desulfobacteraceae bacterium]